MTAHDLDHDCYWPEVILGEEVAGDSVLRPGMRVLAPCEECGEVPIDTVEVLEMELDAAEKSLAHLLLTRDIPLFHWTPKARRKQIMRYGLRPRMRPTTNAEGFGGWKAPYVCFGDSPSWAWALSGMQDGTPSGEWDLWQTWSGRLVEPRVVPGDTIQGNGIHEVRTEHRVFKRHLWLVGSRVKPERGRAW